MKLRSALAVTLVTFGASLGVFTGCEGDPGVQSDENQVTDGASCVATLRILQKDAYKNTAGRSSDAWPPHTTTALEVRCGGELVAEAAQGNHGTLPGAVDENGDVFLVEMKTIEARGKRGDLEDLLAAYQACDCEAATSFLSLDGLGDQLAQDLLLEVAIYLEENVTCPGEGGTDALVDALLDADFERALGILPTCSFADGTSLEAGLDRALADLAQATGGLLADYHVCNNDAVLQVGLVESFVERGSIQACDPTGAVCRGPLWLYAP